MTNEEKFKNELDWLKANYPLIGDHDFKLDSVVHVTVGRIAELLYEHAFGCGRLGAAVSPLLPDMCECGHKWHGDDPCQWKGREEDTELHCTCPESHRTLTSKDFQVVSASPHPSVEVRELMRGGENGWGVPQHEVVLGKLRIGVFSNKDSADKFAADVRAQFFAAAPAQEPPQCSMCRGVKRIKKPDGCGSMTCPKCSRGDANSAAQEQPVENSPQTYFCSNCVQYLTEIEAMDTHDQSHDIVRVYHHPSPQRGKP